MTRWRHGSALTVVAVAAIFAAGCNRRGQGPQPAAEAAPPPIPSSSPLSKIEDGMGQAEVESLLGSPSDRNTYVTGKAFAPYYFGPDRHRTAWYYKGMGRVVFSGGGPGGQGTVVRVEYDPNEPGFFRRQPKKKR